MHARRPAHSPLAAARRSTRRHGGGVLSAGVAQLAEHLFCKQVVGGSSPPASSTLFVHLGGLPERPKGAGCKPAGIAYVGSNPTPSTCESFVCGVARRQALRLSRPRRAMRQSRRFVVGVSASPGPVDLALQDSLLVSGEACASQGSSRTGSSPVSSPTGAPLDFGAAKRLDSGSGGAPLDFGHTAPPPLGFSAGVAQLVEHQPSKLNVEGSNPFSRSTAPQARNGALAPRIGWPT